MPSGSIQHDILDRFVVDRFATFACPKNNAVSKTLTMGQQVPDCYAVRTVRCHGTCCVQTSRTLTEKEREVVKAKVDEATRLIKEARDIARGHWSTNQLNATVAAAESEAGPSAGRKRPRVSVKSAPAKRMRIEGGESSDKPIDLTGPPAVTVTRTPIRAKLFRSAGINCRLLAVVRIRISEKTYLRI
ncbi:hypothetical protein BKA70DRAFT_1232395 [Coprinopsis sp. MPI-PUGE-AT-0042]|nr:hypothetical protein BKA70DRAFT_1232395 [Coprinopsis sp. MPI-PUGE-AT-0042]